MRAIKFLVIHHSAGPRGSVAAFRAEHRARFGWRDVGYHEVIGNGFGAPDGHIGQGRGHDTPGAGVWGRNSDTLHVCLVGNFAPGSPGYTGAPTDRQLSALGHWLDVNGRRYKVPAANVVGHKEIALPGHGTLCPGALPLELIREWYADYVLVKAPLTGLDVVLRRKGYVPRVSTRSDA